MVLIHGWPMQKETFLPLTRILDAVFRCVSFDLIDIGSSRPSTQPTPISFHQQVIALQEAIEALGLSTYALVWVPLFQRLAPWPFASQMLGPATVGKRVRLLEKALFHLFAQQGER